MGVAELKQRLAAILAADVVGFSRLMSLDERATVAALDAARSIFRSRIEANGGRVVDMAGDSVLAIFETAFGAVTAALAIQAQLDSSAPPIAPDRSMRFRIGVHLGDVIEKTDGTIYGDGVNIAARLEGLAEAGGIAVSESIRTAVKGKVETSFQSLGEQWVKNITDPVWVYQLRNTADSMSAEATPPAAASIAGIELSLPDKPSIAVLAFTNLSGDAEQEYFTDGITEDIITELSRFESLLVIARNSSFIYKGEAIDVKKISSELGVRYVVQGSIRRSADRIRVSAQLIDSFTGSHLWAEKYDRVVDDVFAVQDEVVECIVGAVAPQVDVAEMQRARRRPQSLSAYETAQRAAALSWEGFQKSNVVARKEALALARAALLQDPESVLALTVVAFTQWQHIVYRTTGDPADAWRDGMDAAARGIAIAGSSACRVVKAALLAYSPSGSRWEEARIEAELACRLNPHDSRVLSNAGFILAITGDPDEGIRLLERALRVNPRDPYSFNTFECLAQAHLAAGSYRKGLEWATRATTAAPGYSPGHLITAALYVGLGEVDKAKQALEVVHRLAPEATHIRPKGRPADPSQPMDRGFEARQRYQTFLRVAAGLENAGEADAGR